MKPQDYHKVLEENERLRKLLWLRHGCESAALYGDDGKMDCNRCMIDFRNLSPVDMEAIWLQIAIKQAAIDAAKTEVQA